MYFVGLVHALRLRRQIVLETRAPQRDDADEADLLAVPDTLPVFAPWVKPLSAQGETQQWEYGCPQVFPKDQRDPAINSFDAQLTV